MKDLNNEEGRSPEGDAAIQAGSKGLEQKSRDDHATARGHLEPLFCAGLELIPLKRRSKEPVGKWRNVSAMTAEAAVRLLVKGANLGVRLRTQDLVIDVDCHGEVDGMASWARLQESFDIPDTLTVETGGGGLHVYLRVNGDRKLRGKLAEYPGIDFKSLGGYVVAPGSVHPDTSKTYTVDPLADMAMAEAPAEFVATLTKENTAETTDGGEMTSERLAELLEAVDPFAYNTNDRWLELAMACHHATGGDGEEVFIAWSLGDATYSPNEEVSRRRWQSMRADGRGDRITVATLYAAVLASGNAHLLPPDHAAAVDDFDGEEVDAPPEALDKRPTDWIDDFNARFCVAPYGKEVFVFCDLPSETAGGRTWEPLREHSFRLLHKNDRVLVDPEKGKRMSKADLWLESARRRTADRVVFDPTGKAKDRVLNTWRGWPERYAPKLGDWSLMRRVIVEALTGGDEDHADYVLRWMAFSFQRPADLPRVALVFRGGKGTGKGTLGRVMHDLAGDHALSVTGLSQVAGRFNAHLRQKVFVFADEAFASGDREAEAVLKRLITEPQLTFEGKGVDARNGPNYCKLILASNEDWIVPASGDERRYAAFDVAPAFQSDGAFWEALHRQLDAGGRAAMLYDLLAMDLRGWHPQDAVPQTSALSDQKLQSLDSFERWWFDLLDAGSMPNGSAWIDGLFVGSGEPKEGFLHAYQVSQPRGERPASIVSFPKRLGRVGVDTNVKKDGARAWWVPSLTEARDAFVKATGLTAHSWGT